MREAAPDGQGARFFIAYAAALAGATIAYMPFLTILLPIKVASLAGEAAKVAWLAYLTFAGALVASVAAIAAGWLSDRLKARVPLVLAGLAVTSAILPAFASAGSLGALAALLMAWQAGLNLMIMPLMAWAGDCVPDHQKGRLGGGLALAPAAGALATTLVTWPGLASEAERLWLSAGLAAVLVAGGVLLAAPRAMPQLHRPAPGAAPGGAAALIASLKGPAVARMWGARLLMQIAQAALFAFLYFWLRSLDAGFGDASAAQLYLAVLLVSIPVTIAAGRWSDRRARPLAPLTLTALLASLGLGAMALARLPLIAVLAYALFALAAAVFLALHYAQTFRVLTDPQRRAEHLGWFNLANTAPALVMPWLTLAVEPAFGFAGLFTLLAACTLGAAALLARLPDPAAAPQNPA